MRIPSNHCPRTLGRYIGKVWQLTACDCASSFGWARIVVGEVTAALMAAFLTEVVLPGYRAAGWCLRRVLTDNGKEFKGKFCHDLCRPPGAPHADEAAACVDQRVRGTLAGDDSP